MALAVFQPQGRQLSRRAQNFQTHLPVVEWVLNITFYLMCASVTVSFLRSSLPGFTGCQQQRTQLFFSSLKVDYNGLCCPWKPSPIS